jgi:hypothetical protein
MRGPRLSVAGYGGAGKSVSDALVHARDGPACRGGVP